MQSVRIGGHIRDFIWKDVGEGETQSIISVVVIIGVLLVVFTESAGRSCGVGQDAGVHLLEVHSL